MIIGATFFIPDANVVEYLAAAQMTYEKIGNESNITYFKRVTINFWIDAVKDGLILKAQASAGQGVTTPIMTIS